MKDFWAQFRDAVVDSGVPISPVVWFAVKGPADF